MATSPNVPTSTTDQENNRARVAELAAAGVMVWSPERVYIGPEVNLEFISPGAELINAIVRGASTRIGARSRIGTSGIAVLSECQVGEGVELGAGSYDGATMLDGVKVRGFGELRQSCLLEEGVELGHNVGLKNTLLTSTIIAGSNINFCDVVITGGRSRSDHSEIGSGVVHLNFDPRRDKFGSLLGNADGVLLKSAPIFVGGQCGLVAPVWVGFGAVIAAGSVVREDVPEKALFLTNPRPYQPRRYDPYAYPKSIRTQVMKTARLIGALCAIGAWYRYIRAPFAEGGQKALYVAGENRLADMARVRSRELAATLDRLESALASHSDWSSEKAGDHSVLLRAKSAVIRYLSDVYFEVIKGPPEEFLRAYESLRKGATHIDTISAISDGATSAASKWLCQIETVVEGRVEMCLKKAV